MAVEQRDEVNALTVRDTGELAISYDQARAQKEIEGAIVIAKRFPRDEMAMFARIQRACKRPAFAEKARYAFPRGGATISGPSVNLAREMARLWGNVRYGFEVSRDDDDSRKIRAFAWDMESNATVQAEAEFKKLVYRKVGGWQTPDERDLRELTNKHAAILIRNCILQILPPDFVEGAMQECQNTLRGSVSQNRDEVLKKLVRAFDSISVPTSMIERKYGYKIAELTDDDIAELRAIYQSIEDGNSTRDEHFSPRKTEPETGTAGKDMFAGAESVPINREELAKALPDLKKGAAYGHPAAEIANLTDKPADILKDNEPDDMELYIAQLISEQPTAAAVADVVARTKYPTKDDPAKVFAKPAIGEKQQLSRLAKWHRLDKGTTE